MSKTSSGWTLNEPCRPCTNFEISPHVSFIHDCMCYKCSKCKHVWLDKPELELVEGNDDVVYVRAKPYTLYGLPVMIVDSLPADAEPSYAFGPNVHKKMTPPKQQPTEEEIARFEEKFAEKYPLAAAAIGLDPTSTGTSDLPTLHKQPLQDREFMTPNEMRAKNGLPPFVKQPLEGRFVTGSVTGTSDVPTIHKQPLLVNDRKWEDDLRTDIACGVISLSELLHLRETVNTAIYDLEHGK